MRKNARKNQQKYVELSLFPEEEKNDNIKNSISSENKEKEYDISVCQRLYSPTNKEYNLADLFERLSKSAFRSRFRLSKKEKDYIKEKGLATIRKHAEDFIAKRLAPAIIPNDGKQTPMRGHPIFIAQHATGCCIIRKTICSTIVKRSDVFSKRNVFFLFPLHYKNNVIIIAF